MPAEETAMVSMVVPKRLANYIYRHVQGLRDDAERHRRIAVDDARRAAERHPGGKREADALARAKYNEQERDGWENYLKAFEEAGVTKDIAWDMQDAANRGRVPFPPQ